jgi:signal transduction histidine kinase
MSPHRIYRRWLPVGIALLAALASFLPVHHPAVGMLLLSQYGLVLLWQPVYRPSGHMGRRGAAGVLLVGGLLVVLGSAALPFWIALLVALAAGRASAGYGNWSARFHLGLVLWLLGLLWLRTLPMLAGVLLPSQRPLAALLLASLILLAALPTDPVDQGRQRQDFLFSLLAMVLGLLVGMSALLMEALHFVQYLAALAAALVVAGLVLGLMAWLWNPRGGFAGLGAVLSAQLLQLGTPFEDWSARMAELSAREDDPRDFLPAACQALLNLPPVVGGGWELEGVCGRFGARAAYVASFQAQGLTLTLYAQVPMAAALCVQFQLVAELLQRFHQAKRREQRLADYMYVEAVHETGARVTHDIKNLLQSLAMLISAANSSSEPARLIDFYKEQLPEVARRLEGTLARLHVPKPLPVQMMEVASWWEAAIRRWQVEGVEFNAPAQLAGQIDGALLDSVLENFLRNALDKRRALSPGEVLRVCVGLSPLTRGWRLWVEDSGAEVPASVAADLFERPVASRNGYGLGLYQLARAAYERGHVLRLVENRPGCVRLALDSLG